VVEDEHENKEAECDDDVDDDGSIHFTTNSIFTFSLIFYLCSALTIPHPVAAQRATSRSNRNAFAK